MYAWLGSPVVTGMDQHLAPHKYPGSHWVCEEIGVSFDVTDDGVCKGKLVIDGVETNVVYYQSVDGSKLGYNYFIMAERSYTDYYTSDSDMDISEYAFRY